tara:strand:- start:2644 stop:2880 length:237 start_codon:yes stop_codon:yes gene_type:complete
MNPTKFVIVDPEIDGDTTGPDGWPDAWTRNRAGRVAHTADIVKARRWRDSLNKDIDQDEPEFFILAVNFLNQTQAPVR